MYSQYEIVDKVHSWCLELTPMRWRDFAQFAAAAGTFVDLNVAIAIVVDPMQCGTCIVC